MPSKMTFYFYFTLYSMKLIKELLGSSINYDGRMYFVEDTKDFIKIAKAYKFDVFEKKSKKAKSLEDGDVRDNAGE